MKPKLAWFQTTPRVCVLVLTVGMMLLGCAQSISAQWSPTVSPTPSPGTNIYYNSGRVGIGTASPVGILDVKTATNKELLTREALDFGGLSAAVALHAVNSDHNASIPLSIESSTLTLNAATGSNVGIGTTSPLGMLDVKTATDKELLTRQASDFGGLPTAVALHAVNSAHNASIPLSIESSTLTLNAVTGGSVGIGPTTPTSGYKLDVYGNTNVTGDLNVTGNIKAKFQDMAEWVPTSEQLPVGTVVVLDATKSNQVIHSTQAYDTRVAGVVSEKPGITLGEGGSGKVLVATTGRVLVKVDASNGPIHIGDLLVTSDIPGVAMKSEPITIGNRKMHMPGTLIGKALDPLERGSGKILVLLSLQ